LATQADRVEAGPLAVTVAYRQIHVLAREIDMRGGCRDPQIDLPMALGKAAEPVDQPLGGEIRRSADGQRAGGLPLHQAFGAERNAVERVAHHGEIVAAGVGEREALALSVEQLE